MEQARQRSRHQRLAQANHVAEQHPAVALHQPRRGLHRRELVVQQSAAQVGGQLELARAQPRVLREVVGDLEVDQVGQMRRFLGLLACPGRVNRLGEFIGDVHSAALRPEAVEPCLELARGVLLDHIYIQLALLV